MTRFHTVLATGTRRRLVEIAKGLRIPGPSGKAKEELVRILAAGKAGEVLELFRLEELKASCRAVGLDDRGRSKKELIAQLVNGKAGKRIMAKKVKSEKRKIEQYDHKGKTRANNPPVGLVTPKTDPDLGKKTYQYDPHLDPQLQWAGKAERLSFEVPTVSLHVHERIDPRTIIRAVQKRNGDGGKSGPGKLVQHSLFEEPEENPPLREAVNFYKHAHGWSNRLIAGDSLVVMNSLLEKEGMAGKVQMIFIDPPYGIKYGSNFQPFVNKRDVKDTSDQDLTQEPEMLKAFRDTWELAIHSYLTYLRDRLLLARDLLHESGAIFLQIGQDNVHYVRDVLEEVFRRENFVSQITFLKTSGSTREYLGSTADYLLLFARDRASLKYRPLFHEKSLATEAGGPYSWVELADGTRRRMTRKERLAPLELPKDSRVFRIDNLQSQSVGREKGEGAACWFPVEFEGKEWRPDAKSRWKTNEEGMARLKRANRLAATTGGLYYVRFIDDFPAFPISNTWTDTTTAGFASDKKYVVETNTKVIQRCMLMCTEPGNLVFDPTCGSGTAAYVAEQWGRRWITCDTSRVSITLAKQRLMTGLFDYYELSDPTKGVGGGFKHKTIPHVTLRCIAQNPDIQEELRPESLQAAIGKHAERESLFDQPVVDKSRVRVPGPFTVEAVPAPAVRPVSEVVVGQKAVSLDDQSALPGLEQLDDQPKLTFTEDVSVVRYGETYRQRQWRDELFACGIRGKGGQRIEFSRLEPLGAAKWLQCEGETKGERRERVVVCFGPEHAPLEQRQVEMALEEAVQLKPTPQVVVFAAFQFDPEAAKDIDETKWPGVTLLKVQMNTDLLTEDLKKNRSSNESYWLMGQPDVELRQIKKGEHKGQYEIEVHGFDYYNTRTGSIESGDTTKIAMWMLDTDYDGRSLFPRQVFFPMAGPKDGWARLAKNLKAEIDQDLIESYRGTVSLPFEPGDFKRAAVKIVDDRGIESLKIVGIESRP